MAPAPVRTAGHAGRILLDASDGHPGQLVTALDLLVDAEPHEHLVEDDVVDYSEPNARMAAHVAKPRARRESSGT